MLLSGQDCVLLEEHDEDDGIDSGNFTERDASTDAPGASVNQVNFNCN